MDLINRLIEFLIGKGITPLEVLTLLALIAVSWYHVREVRTARGELNMLINKYEALLSESIKTLSELANEIEKRGRR